MKLQVPFQQVDVFSNIPFKGNPVAVVLDGNDLSSDEMQSIANWTNLSETTFVCKPTDSQADYKLRIFTPNNELPFAGHPTLGSAFAVLKNGLKPKISGRLVQESGIGFVTIVSEGDKLFFTLPESNVRSIDHVDVNDLANALGVDSNNVKASLIIDIGAVWMTLQLSDEEMVRRLKPDMEKLTALTPADVTGVTVFGRTSTNTDTLFEVRSFAPSEGVPEDPVCGSGNGCVATMVRQLQLISDSSYIASQGYCVGRDGRVEIRYQENGDILLGGHAVTCVEGQINIGE
ncbi:PhzF family phenazine biosynthesis protein [Salicibibacter cibi]|uniref:PhzF family phenazine biosynthesis protein n=1 Tax=Salicibibacter cibi TaxID=2743001 RepID=A0A7T6ZAG3_9BACI|nr:PhzF family phenazine biosynthesis protein [Salicibibacter cibi]QQK79898.1 PhzF family phenazine biosynthesis protein [Salicibibacter cibi]